MPEATLPRLDVESTAGPLHLPDDLLGQWLVLYVYPRDNTPGCTTEGLAFARLAPEFASLGARILGVSRDGLKSHANFRAKFDFPFDLISDRDEGLCQAFGVIKPKKLYGKEYLGVDRSTFLIDPQGSVRAEWRGVKVQGHAEAVLAALKELC
ncbi:MAG: peroxiredoxin [Halothiobacillaceae bacterium]|nr:MAG: peroxiredoxin [Halothiobacillaceae bacterium]